MKKKRNMKNVHATMKLPGEFEDFWTAYVNTVSRAFGVVYAPTGSRKGGWVAEGVPLADMANTEADSEINTVWGYNSRDRAFYMNATKQVICKGTAGRVFLWGGMQQKREMHRLSRLGIRVPGQDASPCVSAPTAKKSARGERNYHAERSCRSAC